MSIDIDTIDNLTETISNVDMITNENMDYDIDDSKFDKDKFISIYKAAKLKYPDESHYILYMATLSCLIDEEEPE